MQAWSATVPEREARVGRGAEDAGQGGLLDEQGPRWARLDPGEAGAELRLQGVESGGIEVALPELDDGTSRAWLRAHADTRGMGQPPGRHLEQPRVLVSSHNLTIGSHQLLDRGGNPHPWRIDVERARVHGSGARSGELGSNTVVQGAYDR